MKKGKLALCDEALTVECDLQINPHKLTLDVLPLPGGQLETALANRAGANLVTEDGATHWIEITEWDGTQVEFVVARPTAGFLQPN